jgi:hypothetical protein
MPWAGRFTLRATVGGPRGLRSVEVAVGLGDDGRILTEPPALFLRGSEVGLRGRDPAIWLGNLDGTATMVGRLVGGLLVGAGWLRAE